MQVKLRFIYPIFIAAAVIFISAPANSGEVWEDLTSNLKDTDLRTIAVDFQNPEVVYCGSSRALYRSGDGGKIWRQVLSIKGEAKAVNFISVHPQNSGLIFAATENGLFKSNDSGANWRKIFSGIGELQNNVSVVALHPQNYEQIYIGTQEGLFWSADGGSNWRKARGALGKNAVTFIAIRPADPDIVYVAATSGVFKGTKERGWERIFVTSSELPESADSEGTFTSPELVNGIAFSPANPQNLYLATYNGVFISYDAGSSWNKLSAAGLTSNNIRFILSSSRDSRFLYAATDRGVFEFSHPSNQWRELYRGITSRDVRSLVLDSKGNLLWAAAERGVFRVALTVSQELPKPSTAQIEAKSILNYFADEPTISETQDVAVRYAEVHPEKIEGWRRRARMRALFPDFNLDYDKTIWGSYTSGGQSYVGPRDWGVGLSWKLGDLIWNPSQTSIDTRSKLMVQLRDDILNEVTRLYFERRRLQIELLMSPPDDIKEQVEKELRLQELTADIDALTGGYFSERLNRN